MAELGQCSSLAGGIRVVFRTKKSCLLKEDGVNLLECIVSKYSALLSHKLLTLFFRGKWPDKNGVWPDKMFACFAYLFENMLTH